MFDNIGKIKINKNVPYDEQIIQIENQVLDELGSDFRGTLSFDTLTPEQAKELGDAIIQFHKDFPKIFEKISLLGTRTGIRKHNKDFSEKRNIKYGFCDRTDLDNIEIGIEDYINIGGNNYINGQKINIDFSLRGVINHELSHILYKAFLIEHFIDFTSKYVFKLNDFYKENKDKLSNRAIDNINEFHSECIASYYAKENIEFAKEVFKNTKKAYNKFIKSGGKI